MGVACETRRGQGPTETIAEYVAELRRLASRCEFGVEYRDDALRDRLVCGLRSGSIQKKLLTTADLSLAIDIIDTYIYGLARPDVRPT